MSTLIDLRAIEQGADALRTRLDAAAQTVAEYEAEASALRQSYAPRIRRHAAEVTGARSALIRLIGAARDLFTKPKTRVMHGITLGYRTTPERRTWPENGALVALIRERLPERAEALIQSVERVEVSTLTPADIAALGIPVTPAHDAVVCAEKGSDIAGTLEALVKGLPQEAA